MRRTFGFSDQEIADLVRAMRDSQAELCTGPGFPEGTGFYDRWEKLIERLESDGATADMLGDRQPPLTAID